RTFEGVSRQIYSLLPLAAREPLRRLEPSPHPQCSVLLAGGAGGGNRTRDLLLTRQVLCRLSYASLKSSKSFMFTARASPPDRGGSGGLQELLRVVKRAPHRGETRVTGDRRQTTEDAATVTCSLSPVTSFGGRSRTSRS